MASIIFMVFWLKNVNMLAQTHTYPKHCSSFFWCSIFDWSKQKTQCNKQQYVLCVDDCGLDLMLNGQSRFIRNFCYSCACLTVHLYTIVYWWGSLSLSLSVCDFISIFMRCWFIRLAPTRFIFEFISAQHRLNIVHSISILSEAKHLTRSKNAQQQSYSTNIHSTMWQATEIVDCVVRTKYILICCYFFCLSFRHNQFNQSRTLIKNHSI